MLKGDAVTLSVLGRAYISNGNFELGRQTLQKSMDLKYESAFTNMSMLNLIEIDIEAAKTNILTNSAFRSTAESLQEYQTDDGRVFSEYVSQMVDAYFNSELREEYVQLLPKRERLTLVTGSMLLQNGEVLVRSLDETDNIGSLFITTYLYAPPFRGMINQPALKEYYNSIGLPQFWQETKWPKFCRPVGEGDFECQDVEGNWP